MSLIIRGSRVLVYAHSVCEDLVKRFSKQKHLVTASFKFLDEDTALDLFNGLASVGHVEYLSLSFPLILHVLEIVRAIINRNIGHVAYLIKSNAFPLSRLETDKIDEPIPVL